MLYILHTVHYTLHTVHYTLNTVHYTLHLVHCTQHYTAIIPSIAQRHPPVIRPGNSLIENSSRDLSGAGLLVYIKARFLVSGSRLEVTVHLSWTGHSTLGQLLEEDLSLEMETVSSWPCSLVWNVEYSMISLAAGHQPPYSHTAIL